MYQLKTYFGTEEMFKMAENVPTYRCSGKWRVRLNMNNVLSGLAADCQGAGIFLKKSAIRYKGTRKSVFTGAPIGAVGVAGFHHG